MVMIWVVIEVQTDPWYIQIKYGAVILSIVWVPIWCVVQNRIET